jgi:hypothetical protein
MKRWVPWIVGTLIVVAFGYIIFLLTVSQSAREAWSG